MLGEYGRLCWVYLVKPVEGRSKPDYYSRAYTETCRHLMAEIRVANNEKLLEAMVMLLNMAVRSVDVLSRVYALRHIVDAPDGERAKILQCSHFVVEHASLFPETYVLRAEKFALTVKF